MYLSEEDLKKNDFYDLRPDVVLDIVESSIQTKIPGARATGRAMALNSLENRVYDIELEDGNHVVTKFFRPGRWHTDQILEEHEFLFALEHAEVPAVTPIDLNSSNHCQVIDESLPTLARSEKLGLLFTVFPLVKARIVDELTHENVEVLGRYMARIHAVGKNLETENRLVLDCDTFGWQNIDYLFDNRMIDLTYEKKYVDAAEDFLEIAEEVLEAADYQLVHGDCHLGNTLWNGLSPFFLDFDDAVVAPKCQDIWMAVPGRDKTAEDLRRTLLKGYRQMHEIDDSELDYIEVLRGLRIIHYSAWIARRYADPSFRFAFPQFQEASYWQDEIAAIEDVCRLID